MGVRTGAGRYWWIWAAVVPISIWAVGRTFGLERGFPLVPLMSYTPYVAAAALLVFGVTVALRNWAATAVAGVATACLLAAVLPRAFAGEATTASPARELRIFSANIHLGGADPKALLAMIDRFRPDVVSLQELTPGFAEKLRAAGIERRFPHAVLALRPQAAGAGIYARLPLIKLPEPKRFRFRMPRAALKLPGGRVIRIVDAHPFPPNRGSVGLWEAGLRSLPSAGRGAPWVLAGDFNATLDHARLRAVLDRGYRDAGDATGKGLETTWPAGRVFPPPVTIDHVLADDRLGIVEYGVEGLPGSDHRAIHAVLALPFRR